MQLSSLLSILATALVLETATVVLAEPTPQQQQHMMPPAGSARQNSPGGSLSSGYGGSMSSMSPSQPANTAAYKPNTDSSQSFSNQGSATPSYSGNQYGQQNSQSGFGTQSGGSYSGSTTPGMGYHQQSSGSFPSQFANPIGNMMGQTAGYNPSSTQQQYQQPGYNGLSNSMGNIGLSNSMSNSMGYNGMSNGYPPQQSGYPQGYTGQPPYGATGNGQSSVIGDALNSAAGITGSVSGLVSSLLNYKTARAMNKPPVTPGAAPTGSLVRANSAPALGTTVTATAAPGASKSRFGGLFGKKTPV